MVLSYKFLCIVSLSLAFLLLGCTDGERDNICDEKGINYNCPFVRSSSSSAGVVYGSSSSGSGEPFSSSSVAEGNSSSSDGEVSGSSSSSVPSSSSSAPFVSCTNPVVSEGSVTCGGQEYKTVDINGQVWFAENLNYEVGDSKCYGNDEDNCEIYGRLYDWSTAMNLPSSCNSNSCWGQIHSPHQGICPEGWHIPSDGDWNILVNYADGESTAGTKLKSSTGWNTGSGYIPGTNNYEFSALPGGYGNSDGSFHDGESHGYWWSSTESSSNYAYYRDMLYSSSYVYRYLYDKSLLFSVRCLQDSAVGVL